MTIPVMRAIQARPDHQSRHQQTSALRIVSTSAESLKGTLVSRMVVANPPLGAAKTPYTCTPNGLICKRVDDHHATLIAALHARVNTDAFFYYPRLQALATYVRAHLTEHWTLEKAAKRIGLEKKYFSAFFRSKVGTSWTEWVRLMRVLHATEEIRLREESITRIARGAGFRDLRTFERAFKRYVGVPPKVYQKTVRPKSRPTPL